MMISQKFFAFLFILSLFLQNGQMALAISLKVSPIIVDLSEEQSAGTITLKNLSKRPAAVQIRTFSWKIENGQDIKLPTNDIIASPPMMTILPNQEYIVRIIRLSNAPVTAEETYRLLIDELPGPATKTGALIQLLIRHSIPVFIRGPQEGDPDLRWSLIFEGKHSLLQAENIGPHYAKVFDVSLTSIGGKNVKGAQKLAGYVLSGGKQLWLIPKVSPTQSFLVRGNSNIGAFKARIAARTR